ncbi:hypothetical protein [Streptomyces litchfieldiae]|uniref:Uncharacterized protein n=1 Tax=Streptomyces litchfieldiae TaxID=3075543 RepID=A0ABU2N0N1_9ACTN|nr:hypothetical protein [Streptomyces sp. DSM 44938]MDT0347462.1 hypothetical protein [Streptomyces sp. DSM 44938]
MSGNFYSFLPWLRTGIATRITGDPGTTDRASVPVRLRVTGEAPAGGTITRNVEQAVQLYGPGDIIGIDPRAIVRTEPRPWITNVEPNYLAHIEFYAEDYPWRYSPAAPDPATGRLRPWLALVVLAEGADGAEDEFTEGTLPGRPLPFITVADPAATLPPADELGAWAHVHVNGPLDAAVVSDNMSVVLPALQQVLTANPDLACSRLLCPRRLAPGTGYHAFLVPAFETGRLAGLGLDPAGSPGALHPSWGTAYPGQPEAGRLPYYHRWYFVTGSASDFEYLVRLLQPREPDDRVGRRDMDVHASPGAALPGITTPEELGGVLRLGGALQVPGREPDVWDQWDDWEEATYPHPFQQALAALINLADDYTGRPPAQANAAAVLAGLTGFEGSAARALADEVDPVITPPLYGRWHALTSRLLTERDGTPVTPDRNWVHQLNLDPRFRVAANFGTRVVQQRQEELMAAAWEQVGDVLAANRGIRSAQLAREVGHTLQNRHLDAPAAPLATGPAAAPMARALTLTAPAHPRVTAPGRAAAQDTETGETVAVGFRVASSRVTEAPLSPAMRRITRPGSRLMRSLPFTPEQPPEALVARMDDDADPVTAAPEKTTPAAVVTPGELDGVLHPPPPGIAAVPSAADPVDSLPRSPDFRLTLPGDAFVPRPGDTDSPEAARFKEALRDVHRAWDAADAGSRTEPRAALGVDTAAGSVLTGLRADVTVPRTLLGSVALPARLAPFAGQFVEAMAYPVFDLPMYRALLDLSTDLFVPNLDLIPPNSITLLETNQRFIESYLVGLNHEMARELLWREFPTDQRGTPFRQFWDARTVLPRPGESLEERRERLYDIKPIHRWPLTGDLGTNDNRDAGGPQTEELVLVIRGELLKKYPNAAIYAHRARWGTRNGVPDPAQERVPVELVDELHPSAEEIRLPLYEAQVAPDIHLLGFDLTEEQARGGGAPPEDAGWFFVIEERPGDLRFGLDTGPATRVEVWNDLSWPDVDPGNSGFVRLGPAAPVVELRRLDDPRADQEKAEQHDEDEHLPVWTGQLSSADIAYILFQAPVLVAVHAEEMLPDE